jgi:hypothetical protein
LWLILLIGFEIGAPEEAGIERPDNQQNRKEKRGYTKKDCDKPDRSDGKMCNQDRN